MSRRPPVNRRKTAEAQSFRIETPEVPQPSSESRNVLPLLLLLLAGSGLAALIYEIVWFQLLQLVIGASGISLGLLLAAYMGGLCIGSALFARFVPAREHPLRIYAYLELGIAAFGIIALFGVPLVGKLYVATAFSGVVGMIWRGIIAAACLLPPTILMGCSYPAISRWLKSGDSASDRSAWLGLLYSSNIAGAVIGSVMAGFWLLRVYDMAVATYAAAAINIAVALLAFGIMSRSRQFEPAIDSDAAPAARASGATWIYIAIGISGLTALGAEVVWTRLLSLLLGATVYTFSIILAVFLIGLCAGSSAGSFFARRVRDARMALAVCQVLLAITIAFTAWSIADALPYWPVDPWLSTNPWFNFDLDIARCIRAILPATLLWGASFPLALAAAAVPGEDPAVLSGEVYASNTAGSIVGALAFSLLLIPAIGTRGSERLLIWLAAAGAIAALAPAFVTTRRITAKLAVALAGTALLAWGLSSTVAGVPWQAIAYGRRVAPILRNQAAGDSHPTPVFVGEGINASVVISELGDQKNFYVSGKSEASSALIDMRLQRLMGHLPALFHSTDPAPRDVLVVGFGAGVTAGSFVPYEDVRHISICELESLIPPASDQYFGKENNHVLRDPRTRLYNDDARHFILTAPDKYDVITTDPIHPWVKGTSTLYSKEYYEEVREHLNAGGIAAQWLPLYESDLETVRTELATFFSVFPDATVWSSYLNGDGYDLILLGSREPMRMDVDELQRRLSQPSYTGVASSLVETGFPSSAELMATYVGRAQDLAPLLSGVQVNDDLNMRLQYLAGLGVNSVSAPALYSEILTFRKFPDDLLTGRSENFEVLRDIVGRRHRVF